jgi:hypothetical protein
MDVELVRGGLQEEGRSINLVGQFLYELVDLRPETADDLAGSLNWRTLVARVRSWHIPNLAFLMRGLLAAQPASRTWTLSEMSQEPALLAAFERGWHDARGAAESLLPIGLLMDAGLGQPEIQAFLHVETDREFRQQLGLRFRAARSCQEAADTARVIAALAPTWLGEALAVQVDREDGWQWLERLLRRAGRLEHVGATFAVAALVDPARARSLLDRQNMDYWLRVVGSGGNLGHLRVFLDGVRSASREVAHRLAEGMLRPDLGAILYGDTENAENLGHFAVSVGRVSRRLAQEFVRNIADGYGDLVVAELEARATLGSLSRWLKALAMARSPPTRTNQVVGALVRTTEYDVRVQGLLEATEACIECGDAQAAREFANLAISKASQLRRLSGVRDWLHLYRRAERVERQLGFSSFGARLFAVVDTPGVLAEAGQAMRKALALHLGIARGRPTMGPIRAVIDAEDSIRRAALDMPSGFDRTLAMMLCLEPEEAIEPHFRQSGDLPTWQLGLVCLTWRAARPREPLPKWLGAEDAASRLRSADALGPWADNIRFALTLFAVRCLASEAAAGLMGEAGVRAEDEAIRAVSWLLGAAPDGEVPAHHLMRLYDLTVLQAENSRNGSETTKFMRDTMLE